MAAGAGGVSAAAAFKLNTFNSDAIALAFMLVFIFSLQIYHVCHRSSRDLRGRTDAKSWSVGLGSNFMAIGITPVPSRF